MPVSIAGQGNGFKLWIGRRAGGLENETGLHPTPLSLYTGRYIGFAIMVPDGYLDKLRYMKRILGIIAAAGLILIALGACASDLAVYAAASLTDSLREIAVNYGKQTGQGVAFIFGASSTLELQIEAGAPADIFFSADEAKMDRLQGRGLILTDTRKSRLSNTLVIVVPMDSALQIASATNLADAAIEHIALAEPRTVPAGIYSKAYLEKLHLWSAIGPKIVPTDNVRAALAAVESGNVQAGMVYKTDAAISKKVKIACEIPAADGPDISYPMAVMKNSAQIAAARTFLDYLNGDDAARVFRKYGFLLRK
jgi:molybdate transport system substrate-binding protein